MPYCSWETDVLSLVLLLNYGFQWCLFLADCRYNREGEQGIHAAQGDDDDDEEEEAEDEGASGASLSSHRSSVVDEAPEDAEFEQKINRLMVAKQKLRQLQDLVAMVQVSTACFFKKLLVK